MLNLSNGRGRRMKSFEERVEASVRRKIRLEKQIRAGKKIRYSFDEIKFVDAVKRKIEQEKNEQ